MLWIRRHPRDRVEFMISHDALGGPCSHHRSYQLNRSQLLGTAIDQIAHENRRSIRMTPSAGALLIAHMPKQRDQLVVLTMHIADNVKCHSLELPESLCLHNARAHLSINLVTVPLLTSR